MTANIFNKIKENATNFIMADEQTKNNEVVALYAITQVKSLEDLNKVLEHIPDKFKKDEKFMEMVDYKKSEYAYQRAGALDKIIKDAQSRKDQRTSSDGRENSYGIDK